MIISKINLSFPEKKENIRENIKYKSYHYAKFLKEKHWYTNENISIEWNMLKKTAYSTHAEMNAIVKYLANSHQNIKRRRCHGNKYLNFSLPSTIVVISYKNGMLKNSRPCDYCIDILRYYNVKYVIYSTGKEESQFVKEKVDDMKYHGLSSGTRYIENFIETSI